MSKILIIDGNALGYANHNGAKLHSGGMEVQAIFGMVKTIRNLRQAYPAHDMVVLWDGRAQWRFDLHPGYKSNRTSDPKKVANREAYKKQRPIITEALKHLGVRQMTVFTHEADDMAGYLSCKLAENPENQIVLVTGDQDWLQLVKPNVMWVDPIRDRKVTMANFTDFTGFLSPVAFLQGKALQGDTSDVIPGVGGIGEKGAPVFLAEFSSVPAFWKQIESGQFKPTKKAHLNLASEEGRVAFKRNMKLMNLLKVEKPAHDQVQVERGKFDPDAFKNLCAEYAFMSILRDLNTFMEPFKLGAAA